MNTVAGPAQRFRYGEDEEEVIPVIWDPVRQYYYSQLIDVRDIWDDAFRFRRNGVAEPFLAENEGRKFDVKRIKYYPNEVIEVVTSSAKKTPTTPAIPMSPPPETVQEISIQVSEAPTTPPQPERSVKLKKALKMKSAPPSPQNDRLAVSPTPPLPQIQPRPSTPRTQPRPSTPQTQPQPSTPQGQDQTDSRVSTPQNAKPNKKNQWKKKDKVLHDAEVPTDDVLNTNPAPTHSPKSNVEPVRVVSPTTGLPTKKGFINKSFINQIKALGNYDEERQLATLKLANSELANTFFGKLAAKSRAGVKELNITFGWTYNSTDSQLLVSSLEKSEVAFLHWDLDGSIELSREEILSESKPKYYPVHQLFSNKNLRGISFKNAFHLRTRSAFPERIEYAEQLQLFHFLDKIDGENQAQLVTILEACPNLVDLRLGTFAKKGSMNSTLDRAICSLKSLQVLHVYNTGLMEDTLEKGVKNNASKFMKKPSRITTPLRELIRTGVNLNQSQIQDTIGRSCAALEVLMLKYPKMDNSPLVLRTSATNEPSRPVTPKTALATPAPGGPPSCPFSKLTHLDFQVVLSTESLILMRGVLPGLRLTHLGVNASSKELLNYIHYSCLESISLEELKEEDMKDFAKEAAKAGANWKIKTVRLRKIDNVRTFRYLLKCPMKRLFFSDISPELLKRTLASLNFSELEVLAIYSPEYDWSTEAILAGQATKFNGNLKVELALPEHALRGDIYTPDTRSDATEGRLARDIVDIIPAFLQHERYVQSILPAHSVAK
ncbi:hypothetical protein EC991_006932 [Linnemannia zychae]|nr:hypothetical protein EC991_006932 [Linnemannia zychae]